MPKNVYIFEKSSNLLNAFLALNIKTKVTNSKKFCFCFFHIFALIFHFKFCSFVDGGAKNFLSPGCMVSFASVYV